MWLLPCAALRNIDAVHLFQFDGYDFKFVEGDWGQLTDKSRFVGIYKEETLVGVMRGDPKRQLFFFDLNTDELRLYDLESVRYVLAITITEDNRIFLVIEKEQSLFFYEWAEEQLVLQGQYAIPEDILNKGSFSNGEGLFLNEEEFWVKQANSNYILRIDKNTGAAREIYAADFPGQSGANNDSLKIGWLIEKNAVFSDVLYLYREIENRRILYYFNQVTDRFEEIKGMPENWDIQKIAVDEIGNIVYLFTDENGDYQGVLQDTNGQWFDYSALFERLNGIKIINLQSTDFKKEVVICNLKGMLLERVKTTDAIQYFLPDYSIRSIIETPDHKFIVNTQQSEGFLLDGQTGKSAPFKITECQFEEIPIQPEPVVDAEENLWYGYPSGLIKYNLRTKTCDQFKLEDTRIALFTFVEPDRLAVVDVHRYLFYYDLQSQQLTPFLINDEHFQFSGGVQDIHYAPDRSLWVATNDGLVNIKLATKEVEQIGKEAPFQDFRFLCIEPDEKGHLWLGTSLKGLHIYNPNSGEVRVLNNKHGLANNTVVSILKDDDGDRWLATYNGISIVNEQGELLTNIGAEDGLMERENNRSSRLKAQNGKLLIGALKGLHMIDPEKIKDRLKQPEHLKVYLTSLEFFDHKKGEKTLQTYHLNEIKNLVLPASKRFVNLDFALSNYFKPEENQYAYMLKGLDEDWTYIGQQRSLNLSNLPAGRYELLIKGGDAIGNWTESPLTISIYAKAFFYKKTWFFLLVLLSLVLMVSGIAWLWIRRLRSEVRKATYQIRKDKEVIERQTLQLMDIDKAKSIFFTNISHEFRTPLTVISGMAGRLTKIPKERLKHSFDMIRRNSDNLLNLVNQILDLRKLESGKLKADLIQADVIPYLRYIFESFESLARNKDIAAHLLMEEEELVMDHDKKKLLRIVSNLLSNAIKFTPEGGDVYFMVSTLGVLETERILTIKVKDTGIGIPEKKLPRIFDRFYQADGSSTRIGEGTGIGLSLCKELVSLLGGTIRVESTVGEGTVFRVSLPITQTAPRDEATNEALPTVEAGVASSYLAIAPKPIEMVNPADAELPLILLVEDNADVIQYLITCLENQHRLIIARDGQEGVEKAIESIPDAIISDVMMPRKDGFELCHILKTDERTSHIPIILLTAKADVDSRISGLKRGADDYLTKPFNEEELLTRLENQMQIRRKLQLYFLEAKPLPKSLEKDIQQENEFLQKIRQDIETHIDEEDYGIMQICQTVSMSRSQVHRKIKALTGQSTSLFIRRIRLHKARELLKTTNLNISQIAYEVGFKYPNYFSKAFHEEFGTRPTETRK